MSTAESAPPQPPETVSPSPTVGTTRAKRPLSWLRRLALLLPFFAALGAILHFTLVPNNRHDLFDQLPTPVRMWMGMHNNSANVLAFFIFGLLTFRAARVFHGGNGGRIGRAGTTIDGWCLTTLLTVVCLIEILQAGIPGRDGSFHDVATCWTGIICAWLIRRWVP